MVCARVSSTGVAALFTSQVLLASCSAPGGQPERVASQSAAVEREHSRDHGEGDGHSHEDEACRPSGARCEEAEDCCSGLSCHAGTCHVVDLCAGVTCAASCAGPSFCDPSTGSCVARAPRTPTPLSFTQLPAAPGSSSAFLALGDLNGDGRPEVVTAEWFHHTVTVFLNNGSGALTAQPPLTFSGYTGGIALGDLDGDGKLDLVALHGASVAVLHGNGDGTFTPTSDTASPAVALDYVLVADLDGDGKLDVAAGDYLGNAIFLWQGDGGGGLVAKGSVATAVGPLTFFTDVGPGGKTSLVVPALSSRVVQVFAGNGAFGFAAPVATSTGWNAFTSAYADIDGDGWKDLAFVNHGTPTGVASVMRGLGGGSFCSEVDYAAGDLPAGVAAADLDGDGLADLAVSSANDGDARVYLSRGDGTVAPPVVAGNVSPDLPGPIAIADMNGDGKPDLVVSQNNSAATTGSLTVLLQK